MKKKKTANLIMVLIIAAIAIAGVVTAFMLKTSTGDGLGSQYQIRELKDNAVITPGQEDHVCTITIVCDTILDNTNNLNEEKAPFVPRNGTILPKTRVSFAEGDTVFEVLNKVCKAADIQIGFMDRFCGSLIITGGLSQVQAAVKEVVRYFGEELHFKTCEIHKS